MIGCIVLAAGKGERMGGVAKAQLRLPDGRTFLEAILAAAAPWRTVVVTSPAYPIPGARTNDQPERGMISSIWVGLDALEGCEAVLVWPVDTPLVRAATVQKIAGASARDRIVLPEGGGHPTSFGADFWPALRTAATARDVIARESAHVSTVVVNDPGVRADVDTVFDYDKIR
jgi:CTP:molybdopterin cytidylyltransferase MocA